MKLDFKNKTIKKEKGYIIILSLLFSVLSLSFSVLYYGVVNEVYQRKQVEVLMEDTAGYIVEFTNAVNQSFKGFGAPSSSVLTVDILKEQNLLNDGFPEKVGLEQELVAHYATNPKDKDILDYMIVLEGEVKESKLRELGITKNIVERLNKEILSKIERRNIKLDENTKDYKTGIINNNGTKLISLNNSTESIEHFRLSKKSQLGIYTYAPNQIGYWKFQISPYLFPLENESRRAGLFGNSLRFIYSTSISKGIINEGFSYNCPSNYNKIKINETRLNIFEDKIKRNSSRVNSGFKTGSDFKICLETYKSSVDESIESESFYQIKGAYSSSSPQPIASKPNTWGKCYSGVDNYYTKGLSEPRMAIECVDDFAKPYNIINFSENPDIKEMKVNTYNSINKINSYLLNFYEPNFYNKNDFLIPALFFGDTISIKLDNKYIRILSFSSEFISSPSSIDLYNPDRHQTYKNNGYKVVIQETPFITNTDIIEDKYRDYFGNIKELIKNYKYVNNY